MSPEPHDYVPLLKTRLSHLKKRNPNARRARPKLYVPASPVDTGGRPLIDNGEYYSAGITLHDAASGAHVRWAKVGEKYHVSLQVRNGGTLAAYSGVAEIYTGPAASFTALSQGAISEAQQAALHVKRLGSRLSFTLQPGQELAELEASVLWAPTSPKELSLLAHIYDQFCDRLEHPFSSADRHVARRDQVMRFDGIWSGEASDPNPRRGLRLAMNVYLAMDQNMLGPAPGHVKLNIVLQPLLGDRPTANVEGVAEGAIIENTLRFSEIFSTPGTSTDWVVVRNGRKMHVSFGAHAGDLNYTPAAPPPLVPPPLVPAGNRIGGR